MWVKVEQMECWQFWSVVCIVVTAGYNNVEVAEFLLENAADVNAQDKGGLIPLHNASSYGVSQIIKTLYLYEGLTPNSHFM